MKRVRAEESIAKFKATMARRKEEREAAEKKKVNQERTLKARKVMLANRAAKQKEILKHYGNAKLKFTNVQPSEHLNVKTVLFNGAQLQEHMNAAFEALRLVETMGWELARNLAAKIGG